MKQKRFEASFLCHDHVTEHTLREAIRKIVGVDDRCAISVTEIHKGNNEQVCTYSPPGANVDMYCGKPALIITEYGYRCREHFEGACPNWESGIACECPYCVVKRAG